MDIYICVHRKFIYIYVKKGSRKYRVHLTIYKYKIFTLAKIKTGVNCI